MAKLAIFRSYMIEALCLNNENYERIYHMSGSVRGQDETNPAL